MFHDLQRTQTQIDAMNIIEYFIHWIKYFFSADILTTHTQLESQKLRFYSTKNDTLPDETAAPPSLKPPI